MKNIITMFSSIAVFSIPAIVVAHSSEFDPTSQVYGMPMHGYLAGGAFGFWGWIMMVGVAVWLLVGILLAIFIIKKLMDK
ncbi:MAG: hypothetical protein COV70_01190 [Parcubacteria group bacterium CG11_big_fil_rev_8_21_14_0_20_39_22]|nr:MAG: hypothetical protein COV70_01190 [Parcubacteria group bacterium CG11_big_fil_rev_8_21_14_0_20_39_22]